MTDAFANLVSPIFQHMIDFQHRLERGEHPALEAEKDTYLTLLAEAEQRAGASLGDFDLAKHALIYWIDELLISSSWKYARQWEDKILELDIFRAREGGEAFYEKAQEAERLMSTDALETFYLCAALGFRGKFRNSRPELQKWAEPVFARVVSGSQQPERFLPQETRDASREALKPLPGKSILLAVSILVSATALVTLAVFLMAMNYS